MSSTCQRNALGVSSEPPSACLVSAMSLLRKGVSCSRSPVARRRPLSAADQPRAGQSRCKVSCQSARAAPVRARVSAALAKRGRCSTPGSGCQGPSHSGGWPTGACWPAALHQHMSDDAAQNAELSGLKAGLHDSVPQSQRGGACKAGMLVRTGTPRSNGQQQQARAHWTVRLACSSCLPGACAVQQVKLPL